MFISISRSPSRLSSSQAIIKELASKKNVFKFNRMFRAESQHPLSLENFNVVVKKAICVSNKTRIKYLHYILLSNRSHV